VRGRALASHDRGQALLRRGGGTLPLASHFRGQLHQVPPQFVGLSAHQAAAMSLSANAASFLVGPDLGYFGYFGYFG
jgi:hypothetical protein